MGLSALPLLVLDKLLSLLDVPELLSLSFVCKSIHYHANRLLYRKAYNPYLYSATRKDWYGSRPHVSGPTRLEICLRYNPQNGEFLRTHTSTSLRYLKELWAKVPLRLSCLEIPFASKWFQDEEREEFRKAVLAKHPATLIEEIHAHFLASDVGPLYVLPTHLYHFRGLKTFSMTFRNQYSNPIIRKIIDTINCPYLERINFNGIKIPHNGDCLGENLPSLKILQVRAPYLVGVSHFNCFLGNEQVVEDIWGMFKSLMDKGIDFSYSCLGHPVFIDFIALSGRQDSDFMLRWLLQCEFRIQLLDNPMSLKQLPRLNLIMHDPPSRDKVLAILNYAEIAEIRYGLNLCIKLHDHDNFSTVELLPKNISSLSIWIDRAGPLTLVPDIVHWLKGLRKLHIRGFPNGWSLQMSCLKDELRFPDHIIIRGDVPMRVRIRSFGFSLGEGWTVGDVSNSYKVADVAPEWDLKELDMNMMWLYSLNSTLNEATFFMTC